MSYANLITTAMNEMSSDRNGRAEALRRSMLALFRFFQVYLRR